MMRRGPARGAPGNGRAVYRGRTVPELPPPEPGVLALSGRLKARIRDAIAAAGRRVGFDAYMRMALYEPGLGYYVNGLRKFGPGGDFTTAPERSPLFARTLARQVAAETIALSAILTP